MTSPRTRKPSNYALDQAVRVVAEEAKVLEPLQDIRLSWPNVSNILQRGVQYIGSEIEFPTQSMPYMVYVTRQIVQCASKAVDFQIGNPNANNLMPDAAMVVAMSTRFLRLYIPAMSARIGVSSDAGKSFVEWGRGEVSLPAFQKARSGKIVAFWDDTANEISGYRPPIKQPVENTQPPKAKAADSDESTKARKHLPRNSDPQEYEGFLHWFSHRMLWKYPEFQKHAQKAADTLFDERDMDILDDIIMNHPRLALPPSCL